MGDSEFYYNVEQQDGMFSLNIDVEKFYGLDEDFTSTSSDATLTPSPTNSPINDFFFQNDLFSNL